MTASSPAHVRSRASVHPLPPCTAHRGALPRAGRLPRLLVVVGFATLAVTGLALQEQSARAEDAPAISAEQGAPATAGSGTASPEAATPGSPAAEAESSEAAVADAAAPDAGTVGMEAPDAGTTGIETPAATGPETTTPDPEDQAVPTPPPAAVDPQREDAADDRNDAAPLPEPDALETESPETSTSVEGPGETAAPADDPRGTETQRPESQGAGAPAETALAPAAELAPAPGFTDVGPGTMFSADIAWAQSQGIVTGWPDGTFRPVASIQRDAFVAMLFRLSGPVDYVAPATSRFTDVSPTTMFYREISWAAERGITQGWADGSFRPQTAISRDAALAMLYRLHGGAGAPAPARSPFTDVDPSTEHYQAMAWGYANGVTTGWPDASFRPQAPIARDATVAMLHRLQLTPPGTASTVLTGPTGEHWAAHDGAGRVGAPTGDRYRYGDGLRQDFTGGSILWSRSTGTAAFVGGIELWVYDHVGGAETLGMARTERTDHGSTVLQEFDRGGVYTTDGFTVLVMGAMYQRYRAEGRLDGYLGAPIGDVVTGSTGISYQSFKGGQLTTPDYLDSPPPSTPAGGATYTYPTLSQGSRGDKVRAVQAKVGVAIDGVFGAGTRAAVIRFQQAQGIAETGVVDARTWARIMSSPNRIFDGSNGRLAADQLTIVAPGWTLPTEAARAYLAMQDAFRAETGRTFTLNDAYRPIDRQIQLFVAFGAPQAAIPGTSNHGEASTGAIDMELSRGDATHRWLVANAARFGFGQTAWQRENEPWHWQRTV